MPEHPPQRTSASSSINRVLGWAMIVSGFAWAAGLDPWALGTTGAGEAARLALRQAQGVLLAMGFLQLLVARLVSSHPGRLAMVQWLTAAGAFTYTAGHLLRLRWPELAGWVPVGASLNAAGFGLLFQAHLRRGEALTLRLALAAVLFGMLLDAGMGLAALQPEWAAYHLGPEHGVRLRMLRLARVAAIALPIQAVLFGSLLSKVDERRVVRWGGVALACGAVGMPAVLTLAALGNPALKYLLPVPADAVLFGAGVGVWRAFRGPSVAARFGWSLLLASMLVGQLMGGYAFDGPLPAPPAFTRYLDFARSLARIGHAYAILLGLLVLFADQVAAGPLRRAGMVLLAAGTGGTLVVMGLVAAHVLPGVWLAPGPALVAAAALVLATAKVPE